MNNRPKTQRASQATLREDEATLLTCYLLAELRSYIMDGKERGDIRRR